jgi:hypothetical protein
MWDFRVPQEPALIGAGETATMSVLCGEVLGRSILYYG